MKIRRNFPPLAGISVLAVILITNLAFTQPSSALAPELGPSASGAGEMSLPQFMAIRYSFDVRANRDGNAHGLAEFAYLNLADGTEVLVRVWVRCLEVNSFDAVMTGIVIRSEDSTNFPVSSKVIFGAVDNDLNPEASADFITPLSLFSDGDCHSGVTPLPRIKQPLEAIHIEP